MMLQPVLEAFHDLPAILRGSQLAFALLDRMHHFLMRAVRELLVNSFDFPRFIGNTRPIRGQAAMTSLLCHNYYLLQKCCGTTRNLNWAKT